MKLHHELHEDIERLLLEMAREADEAREFGDEVRCPDCGTEFWVSLEKTDEVTQLNRWLDKARRIVLALERLSGRAMRGARETC